MDTSLIPMRWPGAWKNPSALALVQDAGINYLLVEKPDGLEAVIGQAKANGIQVGAAAPSGVVVVQGVWPGIRLASGSGAISSGPTGVPWVDSNGWSVRLAAQLHPDSAIWIDAPPKGPRLFAHSYQVAIADTAARGGRWIVSLDEALAAGIAAQQPAATDTWAKIRGAVSFFRDAAHQAWAGYLPEAVIGVVSGFSGDNEILNLLDRTNEQYRIILMTNAAGASFKGLRALLYPDAAAPSPELRKQILAFVEAGGLLIAGPQWGPAGNPAKGEDHPRYNLRTLGKGRLAVAKEEMDDAYQVANDSVVLVSHRYDLVRFWNGGAVGCYLTMAPGRKRAALQMLFYSERGGNLQRGAQGDAITVQVAGRYRAARLWTLDQPAPREVEMAPGHDATELHLPEVSGYNAVELVI